MIDRRILFATALAIAAGASSCKKEDADPDGLVAATQEGKNTGDFLLNGVAFGPRPAIASPGSMPIGASVFLGRAPGSRDVQLSFYRMVNSNQAECLNLILFGITTAGQYSLDLVANPYVVPGSNQRYASFTQILPTPERKYITGPNARGTVFITRLDTTARIIAGTFEAKLKEFQGPDSLSISKGRFDLKF
jgi:hypothetical protein